MLTNLHIENIAIIDNLDVEITSGFIVLTGETGAGKSIIIDAINMLLGDRVSRDIVRTGEKKAFVSAVFTDIDNAISEKLTELGYDSSDDLILSRELSSEGRSIARINGRPVSVSVLREIGTRLVNIHGQHDNTSLLDSDIHISFLDKYAKNDVVRNDYVEAYTKAITLKRKIENLTANDSEKEHRTEILKYQINEIESADLKENEDKTLEQRQEILVNGEKIISSLNIMKKLISEDDLNIHDMLSSCVRESKLLSRYDSSQTHINEKLVDISAYLDEITDQLNAYSDRLDFDPNELDMIEERLDLIHRLKRKYGETIPDIYKYLDNARKELDSMEFSDVILQELSEEFKEAKAEMKLKAQELTRTRVEAAARLEIAMIETLSFLEMPKVRFAVSIKSKKFDKSGADDVEFLLSANMGEELKPLNKIASGGELSRIMLGIKNVLTDNSVQTMIFDEIDTGISGKAAQKVAIKLKEMSACGQVIVITHLAQIAAYADTHFKIVKETVSDRTHTVLTRLSHEERRDELARIMGGINITDSLLATAEEMLRTSR